jgi:hypothetical protein
MIAGSADPRTATLFALRLPLATTEAVEIEDLALKESGGPCSDDQRDCVLDARRKLGGGISDQLFPAHLVGLFQALYPVGTLATLAVPSHALTPPAAFVLGRLNSEGAPLKTLGLRHIGDPANR